MDFERTTLWKRTLSSDATAFVGSLGHDRLRLSFLSLREKAGQLVEKISADCPGLTVHNISHLDSLWEMASIIAGEEFDLNPAEAFVFGCSILLHDAGMTIAAFPGGIDELVETAEWKDSSAYIRNKLETKTGQKYPVLPEEYKPQANFAALRSLHAANAERLLDINWSYDKSASTQRLLDDEALRSAYSRSIGRIAHSHHWPIEKVLDSLNDSVGAAPEIYSGWPIDEIKIALLLRCADAAHIDRRRAPSFNFILSKPTGVSHDHWAFQNRLNTPTLSGDELIYASGTDFPVHEANAWWLCYDALRLLNKELSSSNAILMERGKTQFLAKRVHGAESPRIMAKRIRPDNWRPVDAEIRVSAPAELAKTLGGKNLYGAGMLAPLRELLQNAVDAIRARRAHEDDPKLGHIKISLDRDPNGQQWLHVEDDGVGMSERVLTGPLLDFGQSFWSSTAVQQEFPGLLSKGISPIGKFGIGFFSVFLLGDHVKVTSKRFDAARSETKVLEFASIDARPILRDTLNTESLKNSSTRVSVAVKPGMTEIFFEEYERYASRSVRHEWDIATTISRGILQLVAPLDVKLDFIDTSGALIASGFSHLADWTETSSEVFLGELLSRRDASEIGNVIAAHASQVRNLIDDDGKHYGRAALNMTEDEIGSRFMGCYISVGGFSSQSSRMTMSPRSELSPVLGVLTGETDDVSRRTAYHSVPRSVLSTWATEQATLINQKDFSKYHLLRGAVRVLMLGGDPGSLPFCYVGGKFVSYSEFRSLSLSFQRIVVPARRSYNHNFNVIGIGNAPSNLFFERSIDNVALFDIKDKDEVLEKLHAAESENSSIIVMTRDEIDNLLQNAETSLHFAIKALGESWGRAPRFSFSRSEVLSGDYKLTGGPRWVLSIERSELN